MSYPILKYNIQLPQFGVWKEAFTEEEIEKIIFLEKLVEFSSGLTGSSKEANPDARASDVSFLPVDDNTKWVWDRIAQIVPRVNYDLFLYDIEVIEALQYTVYREDQHYDWHIDSHHHWLNWERKISGTILLSDPEEYEGGELEIIDSGSPDRSQVLKPAKGHIAFFASHMPHRVRPVTSGTRRSIVFWVQGRRNI